jgi:putative NIF3 family GTP cyclohydrolase 1 type 2
VRGDLEIEAAADVILVHHLGIVHAVFEPEWVEPSEKLVETGIDILLRGLASGKGA